MKIFIIILFIVFYIAPFANARTCDVKNTCYPTVGCATQTKKFTSYSAFDTWLQANKYTDFDIIYSSSTIIHILITSNDCSVQNQCWDEIGECVK